MLHFGFFFSLFLIQIKYRHRRENDGDENFIALAPAEDDDFNLEKVLNKDKEFPLQLDLVDDSYQRSDDNEKFNRFFDSGDLNEESRKVMNESVVLVEQNKNENDSEEEDYQGKYNGYCCTKGRRWLISARVMFALLGITHFLSEVKVPIYLPRHRINN